MGLVIFLIVYIAIGLAIYGIVITDDDIKFYSSASEIILGWPAFLFTLLGAGFICAIRYLVEKLSGGE